MKKILTLGMLLLMIIVSNTISAQDLNTIISKHIEAIGGADNWKKIKSMTSHVTMKAQGAEIKVTINAMQKKGMRVDIEVMGMSGYQILTDKAGWGYMPFAGQTKAEPLTADDVKSSQDQLDLLDKFLTYKDYGKKIELIGKDDVEGTDCFKIAMTDKDGSITTYFLDAGNYQTIKEVSKKKANGKEIESTSTFGNYKAVAEGIVLPMNINSDQGEMEIASVEINSLKDESLFEPKSLSELKK